MRPILKTLWVVYDPACGLCCMVRDWMERQPAFLDLRLVAAGSEEVLRRFPQLPPGELAVVGDTGEVWLGNRAWIICLWALREYRDWAIRLSSPMLLPLARQAFTVLSRNRADVSKMLARRSEYQLQRDLAGILVPTCETGRT
ncbi:MAG: DCC1-like thiol-disulfide oxidoreductase family protein [Bryobacteraceae bacterium]